MITFTKILTFIILLNISCAIMALAGFYARDSPEIYVLEDIKNETLNVASSLKDIREADLIQYFGALVYLTVVALKLAIMLIIFAPSITANTISWLFLPFGSYADALTGLFMLAIWFSFVIWVIQIIRRGEIS